MEGLAKPDDLPCRGGAQELPKDPGVVQRHGGECAATCHWRDEYGPLRTHAQKKDSLCHFFFFVGKFMFL
jgi:hypothetical protein